MHVMCRTGSVAVSKQQRLRVFEKRLLRKTSGPKTDVLTADWRKLHNGELLDFNYSPYIIRVNNSRTMGKTGHMGCTGDKINT